MGKRKERRIAAMGAASRRVKLDLFAEPSGDLGGSPAQGKGGGDDNSKNHAGSPNSPSSSGQPPENPLSLLGQYSDDDLDVESSELNNHSMVDSSPADVDNQGHELSRLNKFNKLVFVKGSKSYEHLFGDVVARFAVDGGTLVCLAVVEHRRSTDGIGELHTILSPVSMNADKEYEETRMYSSKVLDVVPVKHHNIETGTTFKECSEKVEGQSVTPDDATQSVILHKTAELVEDISAHVTSAMQTNDAEGSNWKMVLHEESNQYYYWNILTGETSWNVPDVLAQQTELTSEVKGHNDAEGTENVVAGINEPHSAVDVKFEVAVAAEPAISSNLAAQNFKMEDLEIKPKEIPDNNGVCDVDQVHNEYSHDAVCAHHELSSAQNLEANWKAPGPDPEMSLQNIGLPGEHESGRDYCSHLLSRGECLLERLNTLKGSKGCLIGRDKIAKYTVEVEIRLSDIKSLSSHASSLLPFWLHCEEKFKQLESAVSDEVLQFYESVEMNDVEANEDKVVFSTPDQTHDSHYASVSEEVLKESPSKVVNNVIINDNPFTSVEHLNSHSESDPRGKCEAHEVVVPDEVTATAVVHSGEDVDMDVDMELEDVIPANHTVYAPPEQQPVWGNTPAEHDPSAAEGSGIPPPPDDDWIPPPPPDTEPFPPPPPDNEPFPPPPPEDLPESSYPMPLPVSVTAPSFTYIAQYNSSLEYYGQSNAEIQENNYYAPDLNQLSVPHPSYYYEAAPNVYPVTAPVVTDPSEPGSYHGLQDEMVPPVPGVTSLQSSHLSEAGQGCLDPDHSRSGCITLPVPEIDASVFQSELKKKSDEALFTYVSDQAAITTLAHDSSTSSIPAVTVAAAAAAAAAVPKVQSKVSRNKKRTTAVVSTLKSNKKVSSLVDKWKAAKEELHEEDEDEPENAYEILEKKRQREIEEWRSKQIASGEAKDNANFQPLGGDWRERVKRKRARATKNSVKDLSENITSGSEVLDLDKLSKELPSGWQVYWDESSKQVYYANSITSETTWTKPS